MKITIQDEEIERAIRDRAAAENKSCELIVVETLARELGVELKEADLSNIVGTWEPASVIDTPKKETTAN